MVKIFLYSLPFIAMVLFAGKLRVTIKPFSITLQEPFYALGLFLLGIGLVLMQYQYYLKGYKDCKETILKIIQNYEKEKPTQEADAHTK